MIAPWVLFSLANTFFTSFGIINFKFLSKLSDNVTITLSQCLVLTGIISFIYLMFNRKETLEYNRVVDTKKLVIHMILFVILSIVTRYLFIKSVKTTPNIGYSHLIINMNAVLTFIFSYFLFGQTINIKSFAGIILCILGLFIIVKYSDK